jgi:hypothetical protein
MYKTLSIILLVQLVCSSAFGQMTYQKLKPGESKRREVDEFLGQPLSKATETLFEYKPHFESEKYQIFIQYEKETSIVEQIALVFDQPQSRDGILNSYIAGGILYAPVKPEVTKVNAKGRLEEYFSRGIVLTHESDSPASNVLRVAYYSERLFKAALDIPDSQSSEVSGGAESKVPPRVTGSPGIIGTITGTVQVRMPDGSINPVGQAIVDVYRVDLPGDLSSFQMKTDRSGRFMRVGVPGRGTFVIVASAPGMQWTYVRNVRIGETVEVSIIAKSGDGISPAKRDLIEMGILQR